MKQKIHFITYGSGRFKEVTKRLREEAEAFGCFDEILIYTDDDMNHEYWDIYEKSKKDSNIARGFPRTILINKLLKEVNENDILLYLDAGFEIFKNGINRFKQYIEFVNFKSGILTMRLNGSHLNEKIWTNNVMFNKFNISLDSEIANTPQIESGFLMIRNTPETRSFFEEWKSHIIDDCLLITNQYNNVNRHPEFKDNRHEQSLLSIMLKLKYDVKDVSIVDETWPPSSFPNKKYPFLARRSKETIKTPFIGNGMININTDFGKQVYLICKYYKRSERKCIIEIGSGNGQNLTICIMNAVYNQSKSLVYSFETDKVCYVEATKYWSAAAETCNNIKNILYNINDTLHNHIALNNSIVNVDIIIMDIKKYTSEDFNILMSFKSKYVIFNNIEFNNNTMTNIMNNLENKYKSIFISSEANGCQILEII